MTDFPCIVKKKLTVKLRTDQGEQCLYTLFLVLTCDERLMRTFASWRTFIVRESICYSVAEM